jgi:hypothetical protein
MSKVGFIHNNHTQLIAPLQPAFHDPADAQRQAYNAAFYELGLRWHWDSKQYDCQMCSESQRAHLRRYLENSHPHMLKVYDADFLVNAIQGTMERCLETANASDGASAAMTNWAVFQHGDTGF